MFIDNCNSMELIHSLKVKSSSASYGTRSFINPLNAELNPIRHLLALVGARHIVHISRIRVNTTTRAHHHSFMSHINLVYASYLSPSGSILVLSSHLLPRSSKWSHFLRFPHQNSICTSRLPHTRHMSRPSHSS